MIYGGDTAIQLPVKNLYDTQMMLASINAAKEIYNNNQKRMDAFEKSYGDFYSPIGKDVDYWYNNTIKAVQDKVNDLYARGMDPTRNPQAIAELNALRRSVPYGELARRKQSAETAKTYQKNAAVLQASNKYNQAFEDFRLKGRNLSNWDTAQDGIWTELSPMEYQNLRDFTNPSLQGIEEVSLTPDQARSIFGDSYDSTHNYTGVTREMAKTAFANNIAGLAGNPLYEFHRDQIKKQLSNRGVLTNLLPTEQEKAVTEALIDAAVNANEKAWDKHHDLGMSKEAELQLKHSYDVDTLNRQQSYDWKTTTYKEGQANLRALLSAGDASGFSIDENGNLVYNTPTTTDKKQDIPYGAYDELEKAMSMDEDREYTKYLNDKSDDIGKRIRNIKDTKIRDLLYQVWGLIHSNVTDTKKYDPYKTSKEAHKIIDSKYTKAEQSIVNDMFTYLWEPLKGGFRKKFESTYNNGATVQRTDKNNKQRPHADIVQDALKLFNTKYKVNLGADKEDFTSMNPIKIGSNDFQKLDSDVMYTGYVANAVTTNTGFSYTAKASQINDIVQNAMAFNGEDVKYGIGIINKWNSPYTNGKGEGIRTKVVMGTQNVILDLNSSRKLSEIIKPAEYKKFGISIVTLNNKNYAMVPVTKVSRNIEQIRQSVNLNTHRRIGGTTLSASTAVPVQDVATAYNKESY